MKELSVKTPIRPVARRCGNNGASHEVRSIELRCRIGNLGATSRPAFSNFVTFALFVVF